MVKTPSCRGRNELRMKGLRRWFRRVIAVDGVQISKRTAGLPSG